MTTPPAGTYTIDTSHSEVGFSVRHAGIARVRGRFTDFGGTIEIPENFADATVEVTIQSASVDTNDENRDNHLRSADFWDAENNPTWEFTSTGIEGSGEKFVIHGDLTINGVSQPVKLDAEYLGTNTDPFGNHRAGFSAGTAVSRKDFGLTWNTALEAGGVLVGDKVNIQLDVSAIRDA